MDQNSRIITEFYTAFQHLDAEHMVSFYSDDIEFTDPAFGTIKGDLAKNMWRMLCSNSKDLEIQFEITEVSETEVNAKWVAHYTFSKTKRTVVNHVVAHFEIENGKIIRHVDAFNLWKWSQQALGLPGWLLGWSSSFKKKFQKSTHAMLLKFGVTN